MENLISDIIKWGKEKGINNPDKQFDKLDEEKREAYQALLEERYYLMYVKDITIDWSRQMDKHIKEELGDIGVVWILLCNMLEVDLLEALQIAHNKNKNRKGKTINGTFIKEEDL